MKQHCQIICSIILLIFSLHCYSQSSPLKISVLPAEGKEPEALISFLNTQGYVVSPIYIIHNEIATSPDIIWLHIDNQDLSSFERNDLELLLHYVTEGGSLILSLDAARLINTLGIEPVPLMTVEKEVKDEGYGRMLGLHSFINHPVFNELNGGAYLFKPVRDTTVRCTGFFGDSIPANGKVIAVDWDYIFLREEKKLMLEYEVGNGKILVIGGYLNYSRENLNRLHLEHFTKNMIVYLTGNQNIKGNYWSYEKPGIHNFTYEIEKLKITPAMNWTVDDNYFPLLNQEGNEDYVEVAGERILVMGKERSGLEEIWIHPFMALRDFTAGLSLSRSDTTVYLAELTPQITIRPASIERNYKLSPTGIREVVTVSPKDPVAVVHYEFTGKIPSKLTFNFSTNLRLMWPYSERVTGEIFYSFNKEINAWILHDRTAMFVAVIGANLPVSKAELASSQSDPLNIDLTAELLLKKNLSIDILIAGSSNGIEEAVANYKNVILNPHSVYEAACIHSKKIILSTLDVITPSVEFNEGFNWAKIATDRFRVNTPGLGASLVAGYSTTASGWDGGHRVNGRPGYGWYFGRDGEWSALALLDYGDFLTVRQALQTFNKYQDLNGKIFHELSTSGFAHYDASDATPLYIVLAGRYLRQSGDIEFIRDSWENIRNAIQYCYSTDTDHDLLIENTNVGHGWVEGGPLHGSHTSLYLASCWAEALKEASYIAGILEDKELSDKYQADSDSVIILINTMFWDQDMGYFHHGLKQDGKFISEPSVLPTIPIFFDQAEKQKSESVLNWIAHNTFTTDWGCRILADNSPVYNPGAYHSGSVWPLFTGWVSLAEFGHDRPVQGFMHAYSNLLNYQYWGKGYVEEVLHGRQFKPFGVCPHQCWSETMVLMPMIEGMLGLKVNAPDNSIALAPAFPADWEKVEVRNIKVGEHTLNFVYENTGGKINYHFTHTGNKPLEVNLLCAPYYLSRMPVEEKLIIRENFEYEFSYEEGIYLLPYIAPLNAGQENHGFRLISQELTDHQFKVVLEGRANSTEKFRIWAPGYLDISPKNAHVIDHQGDIYTLETTFRDTDSEFNEQEVRIYAK